MKLAHISRMIQEIIPYVDPIIAKRLTEVDTNIADIADEMEGVDN
jgi:hypothetical protein